MQISRRDALMGATAAAVVTGAVAAPLAIKAAGAKAAQAESAHPLLDLRARREALLRIFNDLPDTDDCEVAKDALVAEVCKAELRIVDADARTHVDALVQIEQLCLWEREGVVCGGEEAMERLLRVLPTRIERLAGEARS